jgi:hypothetical protein
LTRIATKQEVAELFASLFKPPTIATAQGGNAVNVSYGSDPIVFKRSAAATVRKATHSSR